MSQNHLRFVQTLEGSWGQNRFYSQRPGIIITLDSLFEEITNILQADSYMTVMYKSRAILLTNLPSPWRHILWRVGKLQSKKSQEWDIKGLPGGTSGKETACQGRRHKRCRFNPWVRKILWRRAWQPTPVFLPGKSHGQTSLDGYSPWGRKESDMTEATQHAHTQNNFLSCMNYIQVAK